MVILASCGTRGLPTCVLKVWKFFQRRTSSLMLLVHYLAGNQHRAAFHTHPPSRRKNTLDFVHTDVCSMDVRSLGGAQYFVTFIDDFTWHTWGCLIEKKSEVFSYFLKVKSLAE